MKVLKKAYKAKIENKVVASVRVGLRVNFLGILLIRDFGGAAGETTEDGGGDRSLGLGFMDCSPKAMVVEPCVILIQDWEKLINIYRVWT